MAVDLELDVSFEHHHDFINVMSVILPGLARGISPDVTAEATGFSVGAD